MAPEVSPKRTAPPVIKVGGAALRMPRWAARALWLATGIEPAGTAPVKVARPVLDPLKTEQARDLRAALVKCEVEAELTAAIVGPCVVRYEVKLGAKCRVERVEKARKEIGVALGTEKINLLTPIPGKKGIIGIEVPRDDRQIVPIADILAAITDPNPLVVALGRSIEGLPITPNLAKMPHLLVAGATGGGKSACLNALLVSLLTRATPEEVRLLLIDPKKVELTPYESVPHLIAPIVTHPKKAADALEWVCGEMDSRYDRLAAAKVRNIDEFNKANPDAPMARLLVVVDELGDLMVVAKDEVEESIRRITQLARAAGIHLIVATQRPSVDVITGVIKANIPSRLAFAVASGTDSKVILDHVGAENLLGDGDALFLPMGAAAPDRVQGAWVTDEEIAAAVAAAGMPTQPPSICPPGVQDNDDQLMRSAVHHVVTTRTASAAGLQKALRIGHPKAKDILSALEARGIIGPARGNAPREVLAEFE